ncbi:MAG: hypothetical protein ABIR62_10110 [Dokdonella sp.]|uniref:hypothetical protein n=1 Tax=Dokdonella sp. TaxID=2291710 RepID=UPI003266E768
MKTATNRFLPRRLALVIVAISTIVGTAWSTTVSAMLTVGPASDSACQFHSIAAAVQAAGQVSGPELIAVSGSTWTAQTTVIDHDPDGLIIEGGFANCSAGISTGRTTIDGSGAVQNGPLFVHSGNGPLTLLHLIIQNGSGAVTSVAAGPLTLSDVLIYSNHADYGGGLFVSGNDVFRMKLNLIGTSINSNSATANGGGLYLSKVDVSISGGSNILGNIAHGTVGTNTGNGGGIYAIDSNILVSDHGAPTNDFIGSNFAQRNGGGVYYSVGSAGAYEILLWNDRAQQPLVVAHNAATSQGGAFYLSAIGSNRQILSFAGFENTIMTDNESYEGAVVYAFSSGEGLNVDTQIQFAQTQVGSTIPACAPGLECNAIDNNHAIGGSIIDASPAGSTGGMAVILNRARMRGNRAGGLIGGAGYTQIDSSLFADNEVQQLAFTISNDLRITNSTFANNSISSNQMFTVAIPPASLEIMHSLFVQPNDNPVAAYLIGTSVGLTVRDIGTQYVNFAAGTNIQNLFDPFVNANNGDYHILLTSSAVDRWGSANDPNDPPPTVDLDGASRPYVKNSPSTPYDFGAYEAGAVVDEIFRNGFE